MVYWSTTGAWMAWMAWISKKSDSRTTWAADAAARLYVPKKAKKIMSHASHLKQILLCTEWSCPPLSSFIRSTMWITVPPQLSQATTSTSPICRPCCWSRRRSRMPRRRGASLWHCRDWDRLPTPPWCASRLRWDGRPTSDLAGMSQRRSSKVVKLGLVLISKCWKTLWFFVGCGLWLSHCLQYEGL